jgi:intracellular septation protein A
VSANNRDTWLSWLISIVIPVVILIWFSGDNYLGPIRGLVAALMFPFVYGSISLVRSRRVDLIATVGLIGVLLTGGIGLLKLDPKWLAVKEASIPLLIAIIMLVSEKTRYPIVTNLLDRIINKGKVEALLQSDKLKVKYRRHLRLATYIIASSFLLSAGLNFLLAKLLVKSQPGTEAFNAELGRMTALSYPVIVVPSLIVLVAAIVYLVSGIEKMTGVEIDEIIKKK